MKQIALQRLRPSQMTHGRREVAKKSEQYRSLSEHDRQMAIAEKPVPIVLGPDEVPYQTDHHHIVAALHTLRIPAVPVVLIEDLSSLAPEKFWLTMEDRRWTYPYDEQGRRQPFSDMPRHAWELPNNEYRSLAAFARDAGAFEQTDTPLAEFRWADLLRTLLPLPTNDDEFDDALRKAIKLARSELAIGLPGFLGKS
ncbi:chromosome partitioning protein ParB [Burkholderia sp. SG-MS1]|uniref:ParB-like protein n=1 Tax=Paraburkholderia sp. SG-MS1 TaxID=2023741 RepID=UPI00144785A1|nr:ParB/Srx family N-terminal domain-containing protein [Paraburkholderia sp. SG-MS1]NKJ51151.1 chromosome partitioning protein ParB [Paraburkholderia sp. SG-MS1]